ncbi:MAG: ThuA domain-containing protein, partial [Paludisphaera borealis]|uniref:ThuA domain-containing protein n=1 Tax=Paludisphaera borealis TaxID=1387353 RepID=UPI00284EED6D
RAAIEPWAEPALPVQNGLIVWLDAGRQASARVARNAPAALPDTPLAFWNDGSGTRRDFLQRRSESQPVLVVSAGRSVVRFDGKDDYLELAGLNRDLSETSVFIVAAPATNLGGFRGFFAANAQGRNDYTSGFTIDLGPAPSSRFDALNVEGKGFSGFFNVLDTPRGFGEFATIETILNASPANVATTLDGRPQKPRERRVENLPIDELTLGARFYSNDARPAFVQGFFQGDVAEVLVYDRSLPDAERAAVAGYLAAKHRGLTDAVRASAPTGEERPLRTVDDPPPFQTLAPGFSVRQSPLDLTNINNIRYRPDGKLVALAYNGNVYLLSDTDGDGLEDHASLFWDNQGRIRAPIGMALTPPGYHLGEGLFIASKGKCSLVVDENGDGRADREVIVAQGWPELANNVDALGVAVGPDGSIYFGRGTHDYTNAYLVDRAGKSQYDLKDERGTIIKVSPDFRTREIVATGIRFPVALAFNHEGDLFATDQEGATWLPNGNPFDELLHIRQGRHYGFPPRHSRHLPGVIDEPSVIDYTPQHQSTCGLTFNGGGPGKPVFGPSWWAGDAIVCGYSRGKLYRSTLAHVRGEYVGRTDLIGVAGMLLVDSCVAPDGSLVVAAHSGPPDWGSGPEGRGKLFKLSYSEPALPQPVVAWSSGPREVRVAFDRPLEPDALRDLSTKTTIEYGPAVSAGDRFETLRPGYAVVAAQLAQPRRRLAVRGVGVTPDRRTLLIATDPQSAALSYAIALPGLGRADGEKAKGLPQRAEVDVAYSLNGVEARWTDANGGASSATWLPHLDLAVARSLSRRSAEQDGFWTNLETPGRIKLKARLRLAALLRPAVQPGSTVDDRLPAEKPSLIVRGRDGLRISAAGTSVESTASGDGMIEHVVRFESVDRLIPIEIEGPTGSGFAIEVSFRTSDDARARLLPPSRIFVPWASDEPPSNHPAGPSIPPALAGGDWGRGRALFYGPVAQCGKCHTSRGEGGRIGPDLSNLVERDFESVVRDVSQPSAAIHPDYVTYNLALTDGRVLTGSVRTEGQTLRVGLSTGEEASVARFEVEDMKPTNLSTMPEGLPALLGPERMKDLLTFLLVAPPGPAPIHRDDAPPPRTRAEWDAVLKAQPATPAQSAPVRPLRITLAAGPKDHGVDEHDYPLWLDRWAQLLRTAEGVTVRSVANGNGLDDLDHTDVVVWYSANLTWSADEAPKLRAFLERGGGLVVVHYGVNGVKAPDALADLIGLAWADGQSKFRHGPLDLKFGKTTKHPIVAGLDALKLVDESYWKLRGDPSRVEVLATGDEEGAAQPLIWVRRQGKGRVFCSVPGHYTWTFDDPLFRLLLLRGICWTADQPVDRLINLAPLGARIEGGSK